MNHSLVSHMTGFEKALAHLKTTKGRRRRTSSGEVDNMDPFQEDIIKVLHSKAYRRLGLKSQVTSFNRNPYIRNRQTHSAEVAGVAVFIASILGLNTDLVLAIAFAHDMGHVPFGHPGEHYLAKITNTDFRHEVMGVVIAQHVERRGPGLNLTHEVLVGIACHSGPIREDMTPEAWVVRCADKISYVFADYNDFQRLQYPVTEELKKLMDDFGATPRERVTTAVHAVCEESAHEGEVLFEKSDKAQKFKELKRLMYEIYPCITTQEVAPAIDHIYNFLTRFNICDPALAFALMTDEDIRFLLDQKTLNYGLIKQTAAGEIIEHFTNKEIDLCDLDLNW